jgi:hypothetical protein
MMNDRKILELVAEQPGIKAVLIAGSFGESLIDVSASLRSLVDVGYLQRAQITDPETERPVQTYRVTDQWLASPDGRAWAAKPTAAPTEAPTNAPTPAPTAAPTAPPTSAPRAVPEVPVFSKQDDRSKPAIVIDFIRKHGAATNQQLIAAMGINPRHSPASYLGGALSAGYLARDRSKWVLGPNADQYQTHYAQTPRKDLPVPSVVETIHRGALNESPTIHEVPGPGIVTSSGDQENFRFGIWSDGLVEIRCNGKPYTTLSMDAANGLVDYILAIRAKDAA